MDEELEAEKFLEPTASVHIDNTASRCSIAISLKRIADVLETALPYLTHPPIFVGEGDLPDMANWKPGALITQPTSDLRRIAEALERLAPVPTPASDIQTEAPEDATDLPLDWRRNRGLD